MLNMTASFFFGNRLEMFLNTPLDAHRRTRDYFHTEYKKDIHSSLRCNYMVNGRVEMNAGIQVLITFDRMIILIPFPVGEITALNCQKLYTFLDDHFFFFSCKSVKSDLCISQQYTLHRERGNCKTRSRCAFTGQLTVTSFARKTNR